MGKVGGAVLASAVGCSCHKVGPVQVRDPCSRWRSSCRRQYKADHVHEEDANKPAAAQGAMKLETAFAMGRAGQLIPSEFKSSIGFVQENREYVTGDPNPDMSQVDLHSRLAVQLKSHFQYSGMQ